MTIPSEVVAGKIALWMKKETDNAYTYASLGDIDLEKFMPCKFVLSTIIAPCGPPLDQCATIEYIKDNVFRIVNALDKSQVEIEVDADKADIMRQWANNNILIHIEVDDNDNLIFTCLGRWVAK